jgi:hypothetical protein
MSLLTLEWPSLSTPVAGVASAASGADPEAQRWRLLQAVVSLVRSIAAERPLMIVVDHLQWAEPSTVLATLGHLDDADVAYTSAARLERRAGFAPLVALTEYWHARALIDRDGPDDDERAGSLLDDVSVSRNRLGMLYLAEQAPRLQRNRTGMPS